MNVNSYNDYIHKVGEILISDYEKKNVIYCGVNGPYDDPETKVRNLSHLIIIAAIEILRFDQSCYLQLLIQMVEELLSLKKENGLYCMREKTGKDDCNGVIGHSWVIEALVYAYRVTKNTKYINEAASIAHKHAFQPALGLWGRPLMGDDDEAIDFTLNHQLWYAASLMELNQILMDIDLDNQCKQFMNMLYANFSISHNGRIVHNIYRRTSVSGKMKQIIKKHVLCVKEMLGKPSMAYKEEGYHVFNLMALSRIYRIVPDSKFFNTRSFKMSLNYINTGKFLDGLMDSRVNLDASLKNSITNEAEKEINIYGYTYNVPGFELLYLSDTFKDMIHDKIVKECIQRQFDLTYDFDSEIFGKRCHDKNTVNYRTYEYFRYMEVSN